MKSTLAALLGILGLFLLVNTVPATDVKKEDVPRLLKDLKSTVPATRARAARDLADLGAITASVVKDAIPTLLDMAKHDKDENARLAAVRSLGMIDPDPKEALPVLKDALKDKSDKVKIAAMEALGQLGTNAKEAAPLLRDLAKDKEKKNLSRAAGMALKRINGK